MIQLLVRYIKYISTSMTGTVTDMLVLWILSDYVFKGNYWGEYLVSPVISFQCAVTVNFMTAYFYVWKDRTSKVKESGAGKFIRTYMTYNLTCSAVFLLRLAILLMIERFTGWDVLICNISAMCLSGLLNFTISNLFIFKKTR
jgi:putative flippase GtrA